MPWNAAVLLAMYVIGAIGTVLQIGRPRGPLTPGLALYTLAVAGFAFWTVWSLAT